MNQTSPLVTGATGAAMTTVLPLIQLAADSAHVTLSTSVQLSIATILIAGAHALGKAIAARCVTTTPQPAVQQ